MPDIAGTIRLGLNNVYTIFVGVNKLFGIIFR